MLSDFQSLTANPTTDNNQAASDLTDAIWDNIVDSLVFVGPDSATPGTNTIQINNDSDVATWGIRLDTSANDHKLHIESYKSGAWNTPPVMTFDRDGNVGIGTSSPSALLHVQNDFATPVTLLKSVGDYSIQHKYDSNRTSTNATLGDIQGLWNGTQVATIQFKAGDDTINKDDGYIAFRTAEGGSLSEKMRIEQNGNVGIGTSSPDTVFEIEGTPVSLGGVPIVQEIYDNRSMVLGVGGGLVLTGDYTTTGGSKARYAALKGTKENGTSGNYAGNLLFYTRPNGSNLTEKMRITSTGDVGIGISPSYKLHVSGNEASNFIAQFHNDGNNANRYGICVWAGEDVEAGTNYYFTASDGDGNATGYLRSVAGVFQLTDACDERLKNVYGLSDLNGINIVENIPVKFFSYKKNNINHHGFIAQDVEKYFPDAVGEPDENGYLGLSREVMVIPLWKAAQELIDENKKLHSKIEDLEKRLEKLEAK